MSGNGNLSLCTQTVTLRKITYKQAAEYGCIYTLGANSCPAIFWTSVFTAAPVPCGETNEKQFGNLLQ